MQIKIPYLGYVEIKLKLGYKNPLEKEVCDLIVHENKIKAILRYKKETGLSAKESKDVVDKIQEKHNL